MADEAVKTGKVNIQDADDFFAWASNNQSNTSVSYRFYSKKEYTEAVVFLESNYNNIKPVPNTMKLHSVSGVSAEQVMVRETSCYCSNRLKEGGFEASSTCGWKPVTILSEIRAVLTVDWPLMSTTGLPLTMTITGILAKSNKLMKNMERSRCPS